MGIRTGTGYDTETVQTTRGRTPSHALSGLRAAMSQYAGAQNAAARAQGVANGGNTDDPLGLNVQARGVATQQADRANSDPRFASGPLIDPKWAGLFQAISETGASGINGRLGAEGTVAALPDTEANGSVRTPRPQSNQFVGQSMQQELPRFPRRRR